MQRAFQVGKADVGINNQTFHLMEHRRVSLVVVVTINTAGRDDTNRWLLGFHGADLYARGLGTQQAGSVKPESVVVSARRVVTGECSEHRSYDNRLRFPARLPR